MPKRLVSAIAASLCAWMFVFAALPVLAQDENPAKPDAPATEKPAETESADELLDQALQAKLVAENLLDLGEVVTLCERALAAGLKGDNEKLAKKMLSATLVQRGTALTQTLTRTAPGNIEELQQLVRIRQLAIGDLERAVELDEKQSEAYVMLARLYALRRDEQAKAKDALNKAIKHTTDTGVKAESLLLRSSLQEDDKKKQADLDEAVKLNPNDAEIRAERANFFFDQKQYDPALVEANKAIELDESDALLYQVRGLILASQNKLDDATKDLDKAIDMGLNSALAYARRAQVHLLNEKPEQAVNDLNKALARTRPTPQLLLMRAGAYQQLEKDKEALEDVDTALTLSPGLPEALRARAMLLAGSGNIAKAIGDLEKLRADEDKQDLQLLLQLAVLYSANKESRQAIQMYSEVIKVDEKNFLAYQGRADAHLRLGEQAEAVADYDKALELDPTSSHILNNLAWLLATSPDSKVRNGARSIELAKKACELTEYKQAHILSTLAAGYAETGDFKSAIEWSQKAVDLGDEGVDDQLKQELESYKAGKPWRELVNEEEEKQPEDKKSAENGTDKE